MSQIIEVKVPDIGDFAEVPVIELYVKVGDSIKIDDAIATLESDKATMDVPSTVDGVIKEVLVQLGSKVGEGSVLIKVESGGAAVAAPAAASAAQAAAPAQAPAAAPVAAAPAAGPRCGPLEFSIQRPHCAREPLSFGASAGLTVTYSALIPKRPNL